MKICSVTPKARPRPQPLPMSEPLLCPKCREPLGREQTAALAPCRICGAVSQVWVFPAWFKVLEKGRLAENVVMEGESSCFYHPGKQAAVPCDSCGRFLCALCDCEIHGRHFCPSCVSAAQTKGRLPQFERSRTMHDSVALSLSVLSIFVGPLSLVAGPAAIFWALWFWRRPASIVTRSRWRSVVALIIALAATGGWGYWTLNAFTHAQL